MFEADDDDELAKGFEKSKVFFSAGAVWNGALGLNGEVATPSATGEVTGLLASAGFANGFNGDGAAKVSVTCLEKGLLAFWFADWAGNVPAGWEPVPIPWKGEAKLVDLS